MYVAYISGPIKAPTAYEREKNIRAAEDAALILSKEGIAIICPHALARYAEGILPEPEGWMAMDLEILSRCDVIIMLPKWQRSDGATQELDFARDKGIPSFTFPQEMWKIKRWSSGTPLSHLQNVEN